MALKNLVRCGCTQAGDHAGQPITFLKQLVALQNLTDGPGFCQTCGLNDQVWKARNTPLQTRPKQIFKGLLQAWQTCAANTGIGDQGRRAFTGTAQQLMVQTHFAQLIDHQGSILQQG